MKKRIIFSALALPAVFAACTNEEFDLNQQQTVDKTAEWVELNDFSVNLTNSNNDASSRLTTDGKWEASDEVGVAFINWLTASSSNQYTNGTWTPETGCWTNAIDKGDVYANHRLYKNGDSWKFESVVYEGLHYAYYPLQEHTSVAPLEVTLGNVQEVGKEDEFITTGMFAITPLYDLQNDAAGKAPTATFDLQTVSNRLKLNIELANASTITDPVIIKEVSITADYTSSPAEIFAPSATILGGKLPTALYTKQIAWGNLPNGNADKTEAKLAEAIKEDFDLTANAFKEKFVSSGALDYTTNERESSISTTVKGHNGLTATNKTYGVNLFTFPVDGDVDELTVTVTTNYGTVEINSNDSELGTEIQKEIIKANNEKLASVIKVLSGTNEDVDFTSYGQAASTTIKLDMSKATLNSIDVASNEEWADAIKIASQVSGVETINITDNVTASLSELPANVETIGVASGKTFTVSGDVKSTLSLGTSNGTIKVAEGTTLNVVGNVLKFTALTVGAVENYGTINIDEYSSLTSTGSKDINNHGEIVNNGTITLASMLTNCKDVKGTANATHTCTGIIRNNNLITGSGELITNKGILYQAGEIKNVTFGTPGNDSRAISINGATLPTNCGASLEANIESSAQLSQALAAGATTINAKGVIALNEKLPARDIQLNLQDGAEFYIQENAANDDNIPTPNVISLTAESGECLIKSSPKVYLKIKNLAVDPNAVLTIGSEGDTYADKTAINVETLSYPKGAKIVNYGWVYAEKGSATNTGIWEGMDANKKEKSATDNTLEPITSELSSDSTSRN